jgi:Uri superfamily endonuclease
MSVTVVYSSERLECVLNREIMEQAGARVIVRGFGSSECRCRAHLVYLGASQASSVGTLGDITRPR